MNVRFFASRSLLPLQLHATASLCLCICVERKSGTSIAAENGQLVCVSFKWQVQSKHEATHWSDGVLSVFMSELLEMMLAPWQLADFPVGLPGRVE